MNQINKKCQSCGLPLSHDPKGGGTNTDGTINAIYCSYCFEWGKFRQPNWTVQRMQNFVKEKMKERGIPGFLTGFFTRRIPQLDRWKIK